MSYKYYFLTYMTNVTYMYMTGFLYLYK